MGSQEQLGAEFVRIRHRIRQLRDGSRMEQPRAEFVKGLAAGFRNWLLGSGAGCWVRSYKPLSPSYCEDRRSTARGSQEQPGAEFVRIRHRIRQTQQPGAARSSQEQNSSEFVTEFASSGMAQGIAQGMAP